MSIKVKGISVRSNELSCDMEIPFHELTIDGQERMFLKHKDLFLCDALDSEHAYIFELACNNFTSCSSKALNEAIISLYEPKPMYMPMHRSIYENIDLILKILNIPYLELDESIRKRFSMSSAWKLKLWVAKDKNTSHELLLDMFFPSALRNLFWAQSFSLFDAIVNNSNFRKSKELQDIIDYIYKENSKSSSFLNDASEYEKLMAQVSELLNK